MPDAFVQTELDWEVAASGQRDRAKLMRAMDDVNDRFGKRTVLLGSSGLSQGTDTWGMRQVRRTPCYTNLWRETPVARA